MMIVAKIASRQPQPLSQLNAVELFSIYFHILNRKTLTPAFSLKRPDPDRNAATNDRQFAFMPRRNWPGGTHEAQPNRMEPEQNTSFERETS
jgi:hypothetical protein